MNIEIRVHAPEGIIDVSGPLDSRPQPVTAILRETGMKKIQCIKIIRSITGMGLRDAKIASENLPFRYTVEDGYTTEDGRPPVPVSEAQRLFVEAGAICDVEGCSSIMADILDLIREKVE